MRVYVTGMGCLTSLGNDVESSFQALKEGQTGVRFMEEWSKYNGLHSHVGAPAKPYDVSHIPRNVRRSMSPMSEMGAIAALQALKQAGLTAEELNDGTRGILIAGSTTGSPITLETYFRKLFEKNGPEGQLSTSFFKVMNHSVPANVASAIGFNGALLSPSSACASSNQAIILAWELIKAGMYDWAIVGGADELHYTSPAVFDIVMAASRGYNQNPTATPRPFDSARDGLVVSEGAAFMVLESEARVQKRAQENRPTTPLAEVLAGAYICDSSHMSQSSFTAMIKVMSETMNRAQSKREDIDYISAHATGTLHGDVEEAKAITEMFGNKIPVSSLKGHFGHNLAACGALEAIMSIKMMDESVVIPTRNLENKDPHCGQICLPTEIQSCQVRTVLSNNFAFGGVASSLLLRSCKA